MKTTAGDDCMHTEEDDPLDNLTTLRNNSPGDIDVMELSSKDVEVYDEGLILDEFEETGDATKPSQCEEPETGERSYSDVFPVIRKLSLWMRDKILPDYDRWTDETPNADRTCVNYFLHPNSFMPKTYYVCRKLFKKMLSAKNICSYRPEEKDYGKVPCHPWGLFGKL